MMTEAHTALFVAPTRVGKTHLVLNLLKREYLSHFDFIIIFPPCDTGVESGFGLILRSL